LDKHRQPESIAIVGGGITGIAAALELAKAGVFKITLFEKEKEIGGLSAYYQWEQIICDRFYHVILSTDRCLLEFIQDLDLTSRLFWKDTKSGFYGQNKLVSFSSTFDFVRFPFLSFWQKIRMGFGIIYASQIKNPSNLKSMLAKVWLIKVFGRRAYDNIWEPLLYSKLGNAKDIIPATFIWSTIKRLYAARSFIRKQEKMGHVRGGYYAILNAARRRLSELQVRVMTNATVVKANPDPDNKKIKLAASTTNSYFDRVLFTIPSPEIVKVLDISTEDSYWEKLKQMEYLRVICVLLILNRKLSLYYVTNLLDKNLPFTGIIESTNIISPREMAGKSLVYLPRYLTNDDPLDDLADQQIIDIFIYNLKVIFPDLDDTQILHKNIFREKYVQPIHKIDRFESETYFQTKIPNVYLANSSMICTSTLNNNAVIDIAKRAATAILKDSARSV